MKQETQNIMEVLSQNYFTETRLTDVINMCRNDRHINNHKHEESEDEIKMLVEQIVKNEREQVEIIWELY